MWIFLNIVNLVDFSFWYTLKIPFLPPFSFDTKLVFWTVLLPLATENALIQDGVPSKPGGGI
jgi:hypothetical protein